MSTKGGGQGKGHTSKHAAAKKHVANKGKHHPAHKVAAHHVHHKAHVHTKGHTAHHPRGLAVGDWLPVCASEALAMSLRLAGGAVSDEDVLRLHVLATGAEDAPASILEALEAASRFGLAGCLPVFEEVMPPEPSDVLHAMPESDMYARVTRAGLVLGVDVPGPHTVLATPDGWWSWGELWTPWTRAVSEAWVISWRLAGRPTRTVRTCSGHLTSKTACSPTPRSTGRSSRRPTSSTGT